MEEQEPEKPQKIATVSLIPIALGELRKIRGVDGSALHLRLDPAITEENAFSLVSRLKAVEEATRWWHGDLAVGLLELGFQGVYEHLATTFKWSPAHQKKIKMVSAAFPRIHRHPQVSFFGHHAVLGAGYPTLKASDDVRTGWLTTTAEPLLNEAAEQGWSVKDIKEAIRDRGYKSPEKPPAPSLAGYVPQTTEFTRIGAQFATLINHPDLTPKSVIKLDCLKSDAQQLVQALAGLLGAIDNRKGKTDQTPAPHEAATSREEMLDQSLESALVRVKAGENLHQVARSAGIKPKLLVDHRFAAAMEALIRGVSCAAVCSDFRVDYKALRSRLLNLGRQKPARTRATTSAHPSGIAKNAHQAEPPPA